MTEPNGEVVYDGTNNKEGRTYTLSGGMVLNWDVWVNEPFFESHAKIESASDAYKSVLSDVGCTLPILMIMMYVSLRKLWTGPILALVVNLVNPVFLIPKKMLAVMKIILK